MHDLEKLLLERLGGSLKRKGIDKASKWAETYRVMAGSSFPGPWTFKYHPWLREMHDSDAELNVGQKSAQAGFTETVLNITFYNIDVRGADCLYVLPSKSPDASDFSSARFDPALDLSPHLSKLFSDVRNVGHKRAGTANLYIRGAQSKAGLRSIPVAFIVVDEVDVMNQENIPLLAERVSGQLEHQIWMVSTPTIDEWGINKYFKQTTQEHFQFKCPGCNRFTELIFPECLKVIGEDETDPRIEESHLICKECENVLPHKAKPEFLKGAIWVPTYKDRPARGFHINQLYSSTVRPSALAKSYFRSLSNPADEQELYNSKLGLTHHVEGAKVTDKDIEDCRKEHGNGKIPSSGMVTMGADVGKYIHYQISQWIFAKQLNPTLDMHSQSVKRVLRFGKVKTFEELDALMHEYNVLGAVVDAHPEKREALRFATRHFGRVKLCFYGRGLSGKSINVSTDPMEPTITVDRTAWLDISLGRYRNKRILLPFDIDLEYRSHIKALTRIYEKDSEGNPVGRYIKPDHIEDHYAHANNYDELALQFVVSQLASQDMRSKVL
jgi:hypothetical protein